MRQVRFQASDGGRRAAGYSGYVEDCVARAIAILTGRGYKEVYQKLLDAQALYGARSAATSTWEPRVRSTIEEDFGVRRAVEYPPNTRLSMSEIYHRFGDCIVEIEEHWMAIVGGKLLDTDDHRGNPIEAVWVLNGNPALARRI